MAKLPPPPGALGYCLQCLTRWKMSLAADAAGPVPPPNEAFTWAPVSLPVAPGVMGHVAVPFCMPCLAVPSEQRKPLLVASGSL